MHLFKSFKYAEILRVKLGIFRWNFEKIFFFLFSSNPTLCRRQTQIKTFIFLFIDFFLIFLNLFLFIDFGEMARTKEGGGEENLGIAK
jgi:hypothetical protein